MNYNNTNQQQGIRMLAKNIKRATYNEVNNSAVLDANILIDAFHCYILTKDNRKFEQYLQLLDDMESDQTDEQALISRLMDSMAVVDNAFKHFNIYYCYETLKELEDVLNKQIDRPFSYMDDNGNEVQIKISKNDCETFFNCFIENAIQIEFKQAKEIEYARNVLEYIHTFAPDYNPDKKGSKIKPHVPALPHKGDMELVALCKYVRANVFSTNDNDCIDDIKFLFPNFADFPTKILRPHKFSSLLSTLTPNQKKEFFTLMAETIIPDNTKQHQNKNKKNKKQEENKKNDIVLSDEEKRHRKKLAKYGVTVFDDTLTI